MEGSHSFTWKENFIIKTRPVLDQLQDCRKDWSVTCVFWFYDIKIIKERRLSLGKVMILIWQLK